jgi:hypothetical protein
MQNTPRNKSDTARLSRNRFVIVLIRRLWINVRITNKFPITASKNITEYKNIIHVPVSVHDGALGGLLIFLCTSITRFVTFFALAISIIFLEVIPICSGVVKIVVLAVKNSCRCIHSLTIAKLNIFAFLFFFLS